tara:strand:- start:281 stop:451 length:171 start_codon:yes stop_codon:yes gene_type:complete
LKYILFNPPYLVLILKSIISIKIDSKLLKVLKELALKKGIDINELIEEILEKAESG